MKKDDHEQLDTMIKRLKEHYDQAIALQAQAEPGSRQWWWCEGRKLTAENVLLWSGIDPDSTRRVARHP